MEHKPTAEEALELIEPCASYESDFLAMAREYLAWGDPGQQARYREAMDDFHAYLRKLDRAARGVDLPQGWAPYQVYWLVRDRRTLVADSSLRLGDTPDILYEGGHIGYGTRPGERRKGYGTLICAKTLERARDCGLKRVLITCDSDNVASARIIVSNGGVLENQVVSRLTGKLKNRYWVELA